MTTSSWLPILTLCVILAVAESGKFHQIHHRGLQTEEFRQVIWSDEFDGNKLDLSKWGFDIWGPYKFNNELQAYTSQPENVFVENGKLHIRAVQTGDSYTSARVVSRGKGDWQYGVFEIRAALPSGHGLWPAIWMLPADSSNWPVTGEIDIMEHVSCDLGTVHATVHTGAYNWPAGTQVGSTDEWLQAFAR